MSRPAGKHDSDAITPSATLKQTRWLRVLSTIHSSSMERKDESGVWSDEKVVSVASRVKRISLATRLSCALEPRPRVRLHILWQNNNKLTNVLSCLGVLLFAKAGSVSTQLSPHLGFPLWTCSEKQKGSKWLGISNLTWKILKNPRTNAGDLAEGWARGTALHLPRKRVLHSERQPTGPATHLSNQTILSHVRESKALRVTLCNRLTMSLWLKMYLSSERPDPLIHEEENSLRRICLAASLIKVHYFNLFHYFGQVFFWQLSPLALILGISVFSHVSPWHLAEVSPQEHHACLGVGVDLVELRLHLPSQHDNHSTFFSWPSFSKADFRWASIHHWGRFGVTRIWSWSAGALWISSKHLNEAVALTLS